MSEQKLKDVNTSMWQLKKNNSPNWIFALDMLIVVSVRGVSEDNSEDCQTFLREVNEHIARIRQKNSTYL